MNGHDPYELLRRLNPISRDRVSEDDEARLEEILGGRVVGDELSGRRRARQLVAAAVLVAAVAGTAAWAILRSEPATDPVAVECRATVSLDAGEGVLVDPRVDPVADCKILWQDGTFADGPVPELSACVRESGSAVVLPAGPEICELLGLASVAPPSDEAALISDLDSRLRLAFGPVCVPRDEAVVIIERNLDELGLVDWKIRYTASFSKERPCATVGVLVREREVALGGRPAQVPMPPASVMP